MNDFDTHTESPRPIPDRKQRKYLGLGITVVLYFSFWIAWVYYSKVLWDYSIAVEEGLSRLSGFWYYWFWTFSNPVFKIKTFMVGILLLFAPKKESALKSISVMLITDTLRQYIRVIVKEPRPMFDKSKIVFHTSCSCSFGFPSGHSEGSTIFYGLILYELVWQNPHYSIKLKRAWTCIVIFIVLNVMLSRLYFAKHSIPQVILGAGLGVVAIASMLSFEEELDRLFLRLLRGDGKIAAGLILSSALVSLVNLLVYIFYFDGSLASLSLASLSPTPSRCLPCFSSNLLLVRVSTAFPLQSLAVAPGLFWGIWSLHPHYSGGAFSSPLVSSKTPGRVLVMLAAYLPFTLAGLATGGPFSRAFLGMGVFLAIGLLLGHTMTRAFYWLGLNIEGDLVVRRTDVYQNQQDLKDGDPEERKSLI